ncbi:GntR family transcriptional regulator [Streptomyces sp. NPDC046261]|uniref:GntR family transcriptional regulator n=1 Tax=Streptomyces sp. NPDC046261 TaxID=3157200 RepID=UPI0033C297EB
MHYQAIADDLRLQVQSGALAVGARLPSETKLASRYRVSAPTLRSALEVLQAEGLVEKFHGRGNYVRRPCERITYRGGEHFSGFRAAADGALQVSCEIQKVQASGAVSALLCVRPGTLLTEYLYLSRRGNWPQSLARVYVPCDVAKPRVPQGNLSPWGDSVWDLLADAGVHALSTTERITARVPSTEEAKTLRIPVKAPVMVVERTSTDADGCVVEAAYLLLPGDRTEAVFSTHARCETPDGTDPTPRRLPWDTADGKPCFLSTAAEGGVLSRIADDVEAEQTDTAAEVLAGAKTVLADSQAATHKLRFALARVTESLGDVLRVAQSRGARLPAPDDPGLSDAGDKAGDAESPTEVAP